MDIVNEFLAQMYPICGGAPPHHGSVPSLNDGNGNSSSSETASDLNLGLIDLGSINWDLCDFTATAASNNTTDHNQLLENQSATLDEANHHHVEDRRAVVDDLELLDFELNEDVLMALSDFENLHHNHHDFASSPVAANVDSAQMLSEASIYSSINSPSAEQTYSNLDSIASSSYLMAATAHITTAVASPAESTILNGDESVLNYYSSSPSSSSSTEESPSTRSKIRRTRARTIDKKESNKAAAIKYRSKKLKERESLFAECEEYERRNAELKKKIEDTQSEISFIKSLLVEALIAKSRPK